MNIEASQIFVLSVVVLVNVIFFAVPPFFIFALIRYVSFREWVVTSIENGDNVANTTDAKNAVIIFFAFVVGWVDINVILGMMLFTKDWLALFGSVTMLFLVLLGLSQWTKN